jgi:hypothetical protein
LFNGARAAGFGDQSGAGLTCWVRADITPLPLLALNGHLVVPWQSHSGSCCICCGCLSGFQ